MRLFHASVDGILKLLFSLLKPVCKGLHYLGDLEDRKDDDDDKTHFNMKVLMDAITQPGDHIVWDRLDGTYRAYTTQTLSYTYV